MQVSLGGLPSRLQLQREANKRAHERLLRHSTPENERQYRAELSESLAELSQSVLQPPPTTPLPPPQQLGDEGERVLSSEPVEAGGAVAGRPASLAAGAKAGAGPPPSPPPSSPPSPPPQQQQQPALEAVVHPEVLKHIQLAEAEGDDEFAEFAQNFHVPGRRRSSGRSSGRGAKELRPAVAADSGDDQDDTAERAAFAQFHAQFHKSPRSHSHSHP
eukprot:SAG22_NODE_3506_length_1674_cov_1.149206_1_plen_216_part_10